MIGKSKVIAVIPARKESKRILNKNLKIFNGKPLISWTIEEAKKSKFIDKIIISTDSKEIASLGIDYKIDVPFIRPKNLATDKASSFSVLKHALEFYKLEYKIVVLLQPTSPLRTVNDIDNAFSLLDQRFQAIISVCPMSHPPVWCNTLPENKSMFDFIPIKYRGLRSQDVPTHHQINGSIYISYINYLLENKGFLGEKTKAFIMPEDRSIDIDTLTDFKLAELLFNEK